MSKGKIVEKPVEQPVEQKSFKDYLNIYEFETELPGSGELIKFKPITTLQLKRLLVYEKEENPVKIQVALDELITSSVLNEGFNIGELYLQDRFFLLLEIRKKTKGSIHKWEYTCPKCSSQSLQTFNLDDVPVKKKQEEINDIVELNENIKVRLKHITRKEQDRIMKTLNHKVSDLQYMTELMTSSHAASIVSIISPEGESTDVPFTDKKYLLENIPTGVYDKVRDWFTDNDFGAELNFDIKCPHCGNEKEIEVDVEDFFL